MKLPRYELKAEKSLMVFVRAPAIRFLSRNIRLPQKYELPRIAFL